MTPASTKAREIVDRRIEWMPPSQTCDFNELQKLIAAALQEEYRRGVEDAAKQIEMYTLYHSEGPEEAQKILANTIRALTAREKP